MKKVYYIKEDLKFEEILDDTYDDLLAAVRHRNPESSQLIHDEELSQLHDLLPLLRLGYIKIIRCNNEEGEKFLMLEIKDKDQAPQ